MKELANVANMSRDLGLIWSSFAFELSVQVFMPGCCADVKISGAIVASSLAFNVRPILTFPWHSKGYLLRGQDKGLA
ncbi:MAG: hypothetical protein HY735_13440 [Verrucomicrobia bacterium]|nr:hypothetical protein [Verrucomicrobiota bacterium]